MLLTAERLGVVPERCLMIGDSGNDVASARAAGSAMKRLDSQRSGSRRRAWSSRSAAGWGSDITHKQKARRVGRAFRS